MGENILNKQMWFQICFKRQFFKDCKKFCLISIVSQYLQKFFSRLLKFHQRFHQCFSVTSRKIVTGNSPEVSQGIHSEILLDSFINCLFFNCRNVVGVSREVFLENSPEVLLEVLPGGFPKSFPDILLAISLGFIEIFLQEFL